MRVYLAGPMTGIPDHNYPEFRRLTVHLRTLGHEVRSPVELNEAAGYTTHPDGTISPEDLALCFADDVRAILWCKAIALMPGWEASSGAKVEAQLGAKLNKHFIEATTGILIEHPSFRVEVLA